MQKMHHWASYSIPDGLSQHLNLTRLQLSCVKFCLALICTAWLLLVINGSFVAAQEQSGDAGMALDTMFDSRRAPAAKSMGLLQGNFLDALGPHHSIQVALVIDSTESMSDELAAIGRSLPNLIDDLERETGAGLETAIIQISDVGDKETPVTFLSPSFMDDVEAIKLAIKQLKVRSGSPYFPEPVDLGIYSAIQQLPWAEKADVEKWILFIGDAPPYDPSFQEAKTKAQRWYETDRLVDLANQKGIKIHCLLCNSRDKEKKAFEDSLDKTRRFMNQISSETGGLMLDLSYQQVRKQLLASASRVRTEYAKVGFITDSEVEAVKNAGRSNDNRDGDVIRIAVLPFLPLDSITFFYDKPEVLISTEMRQLLRDMLNVRFVSSREIEREIQRLRGNGISLEDLPQALCLELRAEYVMTGELRMAQGKSSASVNVYQREEKQPVAMISVSATKEKLGQVLIGQLGVAQDTKPNYALLRGRIGALVTKNSIEEIDAGMFSDLKDTERAELLASIEALEQALAYSLGDPAGQSLLEKAEQKLTALIKQRPQISTAHSLLASCQFNLAKALESNGQSDLAKEKFQESTNAIKEAYFLVERRPGNDIADLEVKADYELLVRRNYEAALKLYSQIAGSNQDSPAHEALRAHWMLAGIRSGDWGAAEKAPDIVDLEMARGHLIRILAYWPDSNEAQTIKSRLRWDEKQDKNQSPYLPREGDLFLTKN